MGQIEEEFCREMGRIIENTRRRSHILQQGLAAEIGVHRNTLMRWESGEVACPLWMLLRIADVLKVNHLMLLPPRRFTWGRELRRFQAEYDGHRKPEQHDLYLGARD